MEPKVAKKKRVRARPLPPDVNSRNLAIEKRRRTEMNQKFLDMAPLIPALASTTRPSKNAIVNESLALMRQQRAMCIAAGRDLQNLLTVNNNLIAEVHRLHATLGMPPPPPASGFAAQARPTEAMVALMEVERSVLGEFPDGIGSAVKTPPDGSREGRGQQEQEQEQQRPSTITATGSAETVSSTSQNSPLHTIPQNGISGQNDFVTSDPTALANSVQTHQDARPATAWQASRQQQQQQQLSLSLDPAENESQDFQQLVDQQLLDLMNFHPGGDADAEVQLANLNALGDPGPVSGAVALDLSADYNAGDEVMSFSSLGWNAVDDMSAVWHDPLVQY